ncbi:MAG TPA: tetratricopeptide repeat protein [Polyangiaceae bacterium]|nr:tetratricopeptide repeat protein [Polyangiaceae bacterium]
MQHRCERCLREFSDDSGPLPRRSHVHCVFCGATIPLPRALAPLRPPPFSNDVEREADFALGVLGGAGAGFPDTLRQFRVKQPPLPALSAREHIEGDSLAPLTGDDNSECAPVRVPAWRAVSFWASLGIGFAVGGLLAYGAALARRAPETHAGASAAPVASTRPTEKSAAAAARPTARAVAGPVVVAVPSVAAKPLPKFDAMAERRFALDRARAEQRSYRLRAAERLYRQVLARAPHDSEALAGLGELELLRGTTDLARQRFDAALRANADYIPARIAVADLEWQAGHVEAARQAYRDIVELYGADLYPPYVAQRSTFGEPPQCDK